MEFENCYYLVLQASVYILIIKCLEEIPVVIEIVMEHISENVTGTIQPLPTVPVPMTTMADVKIERQASQSYLKPSWDTIVEQSIARFICHQCQKSFYNENALMNHKKVHHVFGDSGEQPSKVLTPVPLDEVGPTQFKFYPLSPNTLQKTGTTVDRLTKCKFLEDTSFLIVTIREHCHDINSAPIALEEANSAIMAVDLRGPFTCTFPSSLLPNQQCRQIFFNCCEYSLHYREEHTKRRKAALRCQVCEKPLDRDTYASTSISTVPTTSAITIPKLTFTCRFCAQTFSDGIRHEEHIRIFHARTKPHVCMVCGKRFMQQGGLQQHMRMHTGVRPFACNLCPKAFTQKAGLEQHIRTHTKVKPFKCVVCDKSFSQSVHLRQHMRTHTNIQPFECSVCGKRFKQSSHLNFHVRSHIKELGSSLVVEDYAQRVPESEQLQLLNLAQLHKVQEGDSLYYGAELPVASPMPTTESARMFPFAYQS